jgi:hypothetical protein
VESDVAARSFRPTVSLLGLSRPHPAEGPLNRCPVHPTTLPIGRVLRSSRRWLIRLWRPWFLELQAIVSLVLEERIGLEIERHDPRRTDAEEAP